MKSNIDKLKDKLRTAQKQSHAHGAAHSWRQDLDQWKIEDDAINSRIDGLKKELETLGVDV